MKTKEEIIEQLIDEVYERFPNESYSDWDIAEYVYDKLQPQWIKINSESDLPKEYGYYWFRWQSITGKVTIRIYSVDNRGINTPVEPTHYAPIIKPQTPKED